MTSIELFNPCRLGCRSSRPEWLATSSYSWHVCLLFLANFWRAYWYPNNTRYFSSCQIAAAPISNQPIGNLGYLYHIVLSTVSNIFLCIIVRIIKPVLSTGCIPGISLYALLRIAYAQYRPRAFMGLPFCAICYSDTCGFLLTNLNLRVASSIFAFVLNVSVIPCTDDTVDFTSYHSKLWLNTRMVTQLAPLDDGKLTTEQESTTSPSVRYLYLVSRSWSYAVYTTVKRWTLLPAASWRPIYWIFSLHNIHAMGKSYVCHGSMACFIDTGTNFSDPARVFQEWFLRQGTRLLVLCPSRWLFVSANDSWVPYRG